MKRKTEFYSDVLGHGILGSINYERVLFEDLKSHTTAQIGLSYFPNILEEPNERSGLFLFPITINQSLRITKNNYL